MGMGEAVKGFRSAGGARFRDPSLNIGNNNRASGDINSGPESMHNMEGYMH
jgi:hypothetical protein